MGEEVGGSSKDGGLKLVFLDLEGTLYARACGEYPSLWHKLCVILGEDAVSEEMENKRKWKEGLFGRSYIKWMKATIEVHKKFGLTKTLFDKAVNEVQLHAGVEETLKELKKRGYITAVISGGFKNQADIAQKVLGIDHIFAAVEYHFDESTGTLSHCNLLPSDFEGKVEVMRMLMRDYGFTKDECAFVGDGDNDQALAKEVGVSISFNGHPRLEEVVTHRVKQKKGEEDFTEVLKYL